MTTISDQTITKNFPAAEAKSIIRSVAKTLAVSTGKSKIANIFEFGENAEILRTPNGEVRKVILPDFSSKVSKEYIDIAVGHVDRLIGDVAFTNGSYYSKAKGQGKLFFEIFKAINNVYTNKAIVRQFYGARYKIEAMHSNFASIFFKDVIFEAAAKPQLFIYPTVMAYGGDVYMQAIADHPLCAGVMHGVFGIQDKKTLDAIKDVESTRQAYNLTEKIVERIKQEDNSDSGSSGDSCDDSGSADGSNDDAECGGSAADNSNSGEHNRKGKTDGSGKGKDKGRNRSASGNRDSGDESDADDKSCDSSDGERSGDSDGDSDGQDQDDNGEMDDGDGDGESESGQGNGGDSGNDESNQDDDSGAGEQPSSLSFAELEESIDSSQNQMDNHLVNVSGNPEFKARKISGEYISTNLSSDFEDYVLNYKNMRCKDFSATTEEYIRRKEEIFAPVSVVANSISSAFRAKSISRWSGGNAEGKYRSKSAGKVFAGENNVLHKKVNPQVSNNIAVSLVVDMSGSMDGKKIEVAFNSAIMMSMVLDKLNIKHEISGFTTGNYYYGNNRGGLRTDSIILPIFKTFNQRANLETYSMCYIAGNDRRFPIDRNENIDGESVERAAIRLLAQDVDRRVMIVFSDGQPSCSWLPGLHEHLQDTVKRCESLGINMIGIGIQSDSVKEFYKNYSIVNNIEQLPAVLLGEVKQQLLKESTKR